MSYFKSPRFESEKLTRAAIDAPCMHCSAEDGTVVAAHYTGFRQHEYGKGRSIKCSDSFAAYLCAKCHARFDQPEPGTFAEKIERSEEFLHAIAKTHHWLLVNGKLGVSR